MLRHETEPDLLEGGNRHLQEGPRMGEREAQPRAIDAKGKTMVLARFRQFVHSAIRFMSCSFRSDPSSERSKSVTHPSP